jgi:hypothetical protein
MYDATHSLLVADRRLGKQSKPEESTAMDAE